MAASQGHGKTIENQIKALFGNASDYNRSPTEKFDIESRFDSDKNLPTSIKTTKSNFIGLADARSIFSINQDFRLLIIKYEQIGATKKINEVIEFFPTVENWNDLKGTLGFEQVEFFHNELKTFKAGEHFRARAWAKAHKDMLVNQYHSAIRMEAKIDSKNQRRLQCSVAEADLKTYIPNHIVHTQYYRDMVLPYSIRSAPRERNEKSEAQQLDQFFTKPLVAKACFNTLQAYLANHPTQFDCWLEPSAGAGSFFDLMPDNRLGVDIHPQREGVQPGDFLNYSLPAKKYLALGNPPFGKNSSLAIQFFNRCAMFCEIIAFIVPKTFKKVSVINKLQENFHLVEELELPEFAFELEGFDYDVPCVFQIWRNLKTPRAQIVTRNKHDDFHFVTKEEGDFAIQRVGVNAGAVKPEFEHCAPPSHYFLKAGKEVQAVFEQIDWSPVKYNTAGNPSIAKNELITLYEKKKQELNIM
jgi:hypothetical protein